METVKISNSDRCRACPARKAHEASRAHRFCFAQSHKDAGAGGIACAPARSRICHVASVACAGCTPIRSWRKSAPARVPKHAHAHPHLPTLTRTRTHSHTHEGTYTHLRTRKHTDALSFFLPPRSSLSVLRPPAHRTELEGVRGGCDLYGEADDGDGDDDEVEDAPAVLPVRRRS